MTKCDSTFPNPFYESGRPDHSKILTCSEDDSHEIHDSISVYWNDKQQRIVQCDTKCNALYYPVTLDEYRASLNHWMTHKMLSGCSHGE